MVSTRRLYELRRRPYGELRPSRESKVVRASPVVSYIHIFSSRWGPNRNVPLNLHEVEGHLYKKCLEQPASTALFFASPSIEQMIFRVFEKTGRCLQISINPCMNLQIPNPSRPASTSRYKIPFQVSEVPRFFVYSDGLSKEFVCSQTLIKVEWDPRSVPQYEPYMIKSQSPHVP